MKLNFLDLFAGIGGIRLGLEQAGMQCSGYVEIDKFARQSYQAEFDTNKEWTATDIRSVSDEEWKSFRGKIQVIAGGFPCQTFSIAGRRKAFTDTTKGTLFFEIARAIELVSPKYFILENVKGLLSSKTYVPFVDAVCLVNNELLSDNVYEEKVFSKREWSLFIDNIEAVLLKAYRITYNSANYDKSPSFSINTCLDMVLNKINDSYLLDSQDPKQYAKYLKFFQPKTNNGLEILKPLLENNGRNANQIDNNQYELLSMVPILLFTKAHPKLLDKIINKNFYTKEENYYVPTFNIIIDTLRQIGYDTEWKVFNSKDFGVPQNRERIIIVGHPRTESGQKVLFTQGKDTEINKNKIIDMLPIGASRIGRRGTILSSTGLSSALAAIDYKLPKQVALLQTPNLNVNKVNQIGNVSNSSTFGGNPQTGRVYSPEGLSPTLNTMQGGDRQPKIIQLSHGFNKGGLHEYAPTLTRSSYDNNNFVIDKDLASNIKVRKLTARECWRLQGFPDKYFDRARSVPMSNSQLYKQAGNSVTVPLFKFVGYKIIANNKKEF